MRSKLRLALTPPLSPRRGSTICPCWNESPPIEISRDLRKLLPLPGGEGWGEGEPLFSLNRYGLGESRIPESDSR